MTVEIIDVTPPTVEAQDVVAGPPGPKGDPGTVSADALQDIVDEVLDVVDDGPDLTLLYANAKA